MKGFLYSQDGSYAFPLGPKVTTIGRENCDISINSPHVDRQHALIEYDDEQRCFILKDLNSSSGTFVRDCRVQNVAVRLSDGDFVRFGLNGLPLEFRIEAQQQESTMPSIFPKASGSNALQLINQTIPSRRCTSGHPQQIDVRQNPTSYMMKSRPASAGAKKPLNPVGSSVVRSNAWTIDPMQNVTNGEFELTSAENNEITVRVDQLEKEVKGRDTQIRDLNERLRTLEPLNSTFTNEVHQLRSELEKLRREKTAATNLITSLQRDLHSKESDLAKLNREMDELKSDTREKDLRLQSLQAKLNLLRDRGRVEEDRYTKEKELVNLRNKIKFAEQQIGELNESVNRLKSQLQDTEKQLLRFNQNEQKFKQECEQVRTQLAESQQNETKLKNELTNSQQKHKTICDQLWKNVTGDADEEYDEDEDNLLGELHKLREQLNQSQSELQRQRDGQFSSQTELKNSLNKFIEILNKAMKEEMTEESLTRVRQELIETNATADGEPLKQAAINAIDHHIRLIVNVNNLIPHSDDQPAQNLPVNDLIVLIRRRIEQLENEKIRFAGESETLRSEYEQIINDKEQTWQQRLNEECDRLREEMNQLQSNCEERMRSISERLQLVTQQNEDYVQRWTNLQNESTAEIDQLRAKLSQCQQELNEQVNEKNHQLKMTNEKQKDEYQRMEKEKTALIEDLNGQVEVYKDQVRQFSKTIVQLEKNLKDEQERSLKLQAEANEKKPKTVKGSATPHSPPRPPPVETVVPVVPVLTAPIADLTQELFLYKSRVQEQEQIIVSLRRDLAGMAARLSDVQGELGEKQKRALEKSDFIIRDQTKELNDTRTKLAKLSDIVDKQSTQIQTLQSDLSKSKVLANQYQLLVDQRQVEIDRLTKAMEQKNLQVERVEKTQHDEGRVTHELVAIGAQCKGERHEQTIGRQREALNELRARIKSLEQSRPINPSYEKVLQQVVLLKRELAELRARQALPADLPFLNQGSGANSFYQPSSISLGISPAMTNTSDLTPEAQKIIEERAAHVETMNTLHSCDELHSSFTRKLVQLLDIDDDTLATVLPLATTPSTDRYVAIQQRQRTVAVLLQKIEMLHERLRRKEQLLHDYEKDLARLRQAEILLREKDVFIQDLETDKRSKDDETLFLRNTLRQTQDSLNQEKRINSGIKLGRNIDQTTSSLSNDVIRRTGSASTKPNTFHRRCSPDHTAYAVRTGKRDVNEKLSRKDYEIKTLKQELHDALDTLTEQSNKVKLLEMESQDISHSSYHS